MSESPQWSSGPMMSGFPMSTRGTKLIAIWLGVGLFVGLLAFHIAILYPRPGFGQPASPDVANYFLTVRALGVISMVAMDAVSAFAVTVAYWGLSKPEMPEGSRRGQFLFAVVLTAIWIIFSTSAISLIRSSIP